MVPRDIQEQDATPRGVTDRRRALAEGLERHEPTRITAEGRLD